MSLQDISHLGFGGRGLNADLLKALAELQGLKFNIVEGAAAEAAIALSGIEYNDTLIAVLNMTDLADLDVADFTIADRRASGTFNVDSTVEDGDTIELNGKIYIFEEVDSYENICYNPAPGVIPIVVGACGVDVNEVADRLAKTIMSNDKDIEASADDDFVTVIWRTPGTAGNSITMGDEYANGHVTASGSTLSGGTATQSFSGADSTASKKLLVVWADKQ